MTMQKTLNDLLDFAINAEISAQKLYSEASEIVEEQSGKQFLSGLAEEEKGHQTMLESIKEMEIFDGGLIVDEESLFEAGKDIHVTNDEFTKENDIEQIMLIALKREFKAKTRYEKMALITNNSEMKSIFSTLAKEEENHHKTISKKFSLQQGEMGYEM
jgi:rubrerythrin